MSRGREKRKTTVISLIAALSLLSLSAFCGTALAAESADQGAILLENRCGNCHGVDKVTSKSKSPQAWEVTVSRMVKKGAKLTDEEQALLVDYLAKTYPTK